MWQKLEDKWWNYKDETKNEMKYVNRCFPTWTRPVWPSCSPLCTWWRRRTDGRWFQPRRSERRDCRPSPDSLSPPSRRTPGSLRTCRQKHPSKMTNILWFQLFFVRYDSRFNTFCCWTVQTKVFRLKTLLINWEILSRNKVTYCRSCSNMVDAFITSFLWTGPMLIPAYCTQTQRSKVTDDSCWQFISQNTLQIED